MVKQSISMGKVVMVKQSISTGKVNLALRLGSIGLKIEWTSMRVRAREEVYRRRNKMDL